jgi:hypothetical protein
LFGFGYFQGTVRVGVPTMWSWERESKFKLDVDE